MITIILRGKKTILDQKKQIKERKNRKQQKEWRIYGREQKKISTQYQQQQDEVFGGWERLDEENNLNLRLFLIWGEKKTKNFLIYAYTNYSALLR